jgi:hypothetical protein
MQNKKKILLVTTSNLSGNPRLYKEYLFLKYNFDVSILCFEPLEEWKSIENDCLGNVLSNKIKYIKAVKSFSIQWILINFINRLMVLLWKVKIYNTLIASFASNKRSIQLFLYFFFNKNNFKADLVICHTLGALYPAYFFSKKYLSKIGFDMEDYHPGEKVDFDKENEINRRNYLFKKLLPKVNYISYASPLFLTQTNSNFSLPDKTFQIILLNSFYQNEFNKIAIIKNQSISLVWFSQTIGKGRGLELLIEALSHTKFSDVFTLYLYGTVNDSVFFNQYLKKDFIKINKPISQKQLHLKLSEFDVGLALELSDIDLNKNLALSNKLFAYMQSGLFIIATNTHAQSDFFKSFPNHFFLISQSKDDFERALEYIQFNIDEIRKSKEERFENAKVLSYDSNCSILGKTISKVINS